MKIQVRILVGVSGSHAPRAKAPLAFDLWAKVDTQVQFLVGTTITGALVKQDHTTPAKSNFGCNSRGLHLQRLVVEK